MSIDYQIFSDVSGVTLGGTAVHGVGGISLTRKVSELHASGDDDIYEPAARTGARSLAGTIVLADLAQAHLLAGMSGTLAFVWHDGRGQGDKTVTVTGVSITGVDMNASHRCASDARVAFVAESSDGVSDPLTVAQE